jgi:hypothetical protein
MPRDELLDLAGDCPDCARIAIDDALRDVPVLYGEPSPPTIVGGVPSLPQC